MEGPLDIVNCDDNTQHIFAILYSAISDLIKENKVPHIKVFQPGMGDAESFILKSFENKVSDLVDLVYFLCVEDRGKSNTLMQNLDDLFTEFRGFCNENGLTHMDGHLITYSGVLGLICKDCNAYYLTFCLESNKEIGSA